MVYDVEGLDEFHNQSIKSYMNIVMRLRQT